MRKIAFAVVVLILVPGCITRYATLVDFESGEVLKGKFTDSMATDGTVEVKMPDGEVLKGRYSGVRGIDQVSFTTATAFALVHGRCGSGVASASGIGSQRITGGQGKVYALLTSTKPGSKLVMEIVAIYGVLDGHGYGEARTNDGRVYKVQF